MTTTRGVDTIAAATIASANRGLGWGEKARRLHATWPKVATGFALHTYVMQRRMARARSLLLHAETPVHEVALATGFRSNAHFIGQFRRMVGASPARWRDSVLCVGARARPGQGAGGE